MFVISSFSSVLIDFGNIFLKVEAGILVIPANGSLAASQAAYVTPLPITFQVVLAT